MGNKNTNNTEGAILATLFKSVIMDLNYNNKKEWLISRYINRGNMLKVMKKKTASSLSKNIESDSITWKVFIDLLLNLLNVKKCVFKIELTHSNGVVTRNQVTVTNPNAEKEKDDGADVRK